jgi:hypothetical protein
MTWTSPSLGRTACDLDVSASNGGRVVATGMTMMIAKQEICCVATYKFRNDFGRSSLVHL